MNLNPVRPELLFQKNDPQDPRVGEFVNVSQKNKVAILGYPDDEGIQNNGGRKGAGFAPDCIRSYLYKMTLPLLRPTAVPIQDLGNLKIEKTLENRHAHAKEILKAQLRTSPVLTLGGGHDYGFPDGAAFLETFPEKPLVINFDAHLDVRPYAQENPITSGTPFYRLLKNYKDFDLLEIGIQSQCNSSFHYEWALQKNAQILLYDEIQYSGEKASNKMLEFLEPFILKKRPTYMSIDMDVFSSAFAPGCSQVFATGLTAHEFMPVLKVLLKRLDIKILGIYETSPALDMDDRTSKFAAQIAYEFLFSF